jgi:PAS domain S-box-containing protein
LQQNEPSHRENVEPLLEESAEDLYENAPCGYLSALPDGELVKVNGTLLSWTRYGREEILGRRFQDLLTPGGRIYHETHYAPLLRMQGAVREIALELVCADGRRLPVLVNSVLRTDDAGEPLLVRTTVFDATHRREYERELLRAREQERAARQRTERLQRLTTALAAAVDAREMAEAVVAELADGLRADQVTLALLQPESNQLTVVSRHGNGPDALGAWASCAGAAKASLDEVVRAGRPIFWSVVRADTAPQASERTPVGRFDALVALPLGARGKPIGVVCLGFVTERSFDEQERAFMDTCAGQCSQALERAQLYENERSVAHTLQQSMLAGEPPEDPRFALAACYLPAVKSLDVGGDWHDTFLVRDGTIGVVVGDVVGRGIEAASAMGQLRSATRALASAELGPTRVLERLDDFVRPLPSAHMATVVYAELDLETGRLRYACAGHPPPLVLQPSEPATLVWEGRSAPLGAYLDKRPSTEGQLDLLPGARLVLYTDGLVERRRAPIDAGFARLADEVEARREAPIGTLLDGLIGALAGKDEPADDICAICLEYDVPSA